MDPVSFLIKCATHAAGNQLREMHKNREQAAAEQRAAHEQVAAEQRAAQEREREAREPVYRAAQEAQRTAEAARLKVQNAAYHKEKTLRKVQTSMFWLSFICGTFGFFSASQGADAGPLVLPWLAFGAIWLALCFVPKRFS